jgi:hypothetical protein
VIPAVRTIALPCCLESSLGKENAMLPPPIALGLSLCDYVIVEEGTKKVSLIGTFTGIVVDHFPAVPQLFSVFSALIDGLGNATMKIAITNQETSEEIYARERQIHFPSRLTEVFIHYRIGQCRFASPGLYQATLFVDNDWVAQRQFRVYSSGTMP